MNFQQPFNTLTEADIARFEFSQERFELEEYRQQFATLGLPDYNDQ